LVNRLFGGPVGLRGAAPCLSSKFRCYESSLIPSAGWIASHLGNEGNPNMSDQNKNFTDKSTSGSQSGQHNSQTGQQDKSQQGSTQQQGQRDQNSKDNKGQEGQKTGNR
jgi:hypothetical protein